MNIWVDICHTPQLNLFKQFIIDASKSGHFVYITIMDRGRLAKVVKKELDGVPNTQIDVIGRHRMTRWSVYVEANLLRLFQLFFWAIGKHINVVFSSALLTSIVAKILHFPSYCFGDDPQTKLYPIYVQMATQAHACIYEASNSMIIRKRDKILPALKEWTYLSPKYFIPNVKSLDSYKLVPKTYIFLREVSVSTVNYSGQNGGIILAVANVIEKWSKQNKIQVLFSLEEKHRRNEYPADWILLQEPIEDIHSLMYYAAGLVSSGDSMAREAALLGIPAYYLGVRHSMPANLAASKVANLQNEVTMTFENWLQSIQGKDPITLMQDQDILRKKIDSKFIDINQYMMDLVESVKH